MNPIEKQEKIRMNTWKQRKFQPIVWLVVMASMVLWNAPSAYAQQAAGPDIHSWSSPDAGDEQTPDIITAPDDAPTILEHPKSVTVAPGGAAVFTIKAEGSAPLNYQWQRDGVDIPGATGTTLGWTNLQLSDDGTQIRCVVSNSEGIATSDIAIIHVQNPDGSPFILENPQDATGVVGGSASFSVKAGGAEPLSYQWQRNGADIPGANDATLQLNSLSLTDNGAEFRSVVTNASGNATSDSATLTVKPAAPKVTVIQGEHGQVAVTPNKPAYAYDETVTFTAIPDSGYRLDSWGGNQAGAANPLVVILQGDVTVAPTFKLNVTPLSDDFNTCALNTNLWTFTDPVGDSSHAITGEEKLSIFVPGGTRHDLWTNADEAPRMMQPAEDGDLDLVAKFDSPVTDPFQIQGLLVEGANGSKVRADFRWDGSTVRIFAATMVNSGSGLVATGQMDIAIAPPNGSSLYVRLIRTGDEWALQHSFNGDAWVSDGTFSFAMSVEKAGVFAGNAGPTNPAHTAVVDYFFNMVAPISPEDGKPRNLPLNIIGQGQATKNPDKSSYACNEPVELTATPDAGGQFLGWNGAATGATSPVTINYNIGDAVTATFSQFASYTLAVSTEGQGGVNKSPDQATYPEGTQVILTATPNAGWAFKEWQGDVPTGSANPTLVLTMDGDKTVKAIFQQTYSLTVTTEGQGSVDKNPDQVTYPAGTQVTLTATPDTGWFFKEWQGDVPAGSTDPTLALTMDGDKTVKAVFVEGYSLTVGGPEGKGSVTINPNQPIHPAGTMVTLTAIPDNGWSFKEWRGDAPVGSTNAVLVLTMDANKTIKAVFEPTVTQVFLPLIEK